MKRCWIFCLFIFAFSFAKAQNFDVSLVSSLMPGRVEGRGKYFEIKNSPYFNITLESSEEIEIILESIPKSINLRIEPSLKNSTILTLRGLEPKKVYYKYQDTYQNGTKIFSDEEGNVSWVQDLTEKHYIWIQEEKGTFIFPKDCPNWDETNSVCTLYEDIQETIEISESDFTLDCNFNKIKGNSTHGIYIAGKNNVTIKNCDIQGFSFGIYSASSTGIRIENSSFTNLLYSKIFSGIFLTNSSSSTIENNNFYDISYGIRVEDSSQNVIAKNNIFSSNNFGIFLYRSSFNFVNQNTFLESGLFVFDSYQNIVEENTVNEKPLIYLEGKENIEIKGAGQVIIVNSKNIKVEGESISNVSVGVEFFQVKDSEIANNQFTGNLYDVFLYSSSNNQIIKNLFSSSPTGSGIYFSSSTENKIKENIFSGKGVGLSLDASSGNFIEKNVFSNNVWYGILFVNSNFPSANNVITKNTISGNYHGIRFDSNQSRSNLIYLNNFLNNTSSVHYNFTPYFPNNWNSIYKIAYSYQGKIFNNYLGNYWQDYQGKDEDGDGIGDSPHFITQSEKDAYPIISTFENYSEISFATSSISINYFPKEPVKGTKVVFRAVSSIPFTKFEWHIASSTFFGTTTEFTFNENGEYQITLTATDNDGATSSTSTTIRVEPFSFAIITDLHIGRGYSDYGSEGFDDEDNGEEYYLTQRLRNVVKWINQNKDNIQCDNATCSIKFLAVLGDIADTAEKSEFCKAKEILDELEIPYIPVFGNHDVWPYTEKESATTTLGEDFFERIFWSTSTPCENASSTRNSETLLREFNFERDVQNPKFKNFAFTFGGIHFIGLDFNSREREKKWYLGPTGAKSKAVNHPETIEWLKKKLNELGGKEPVIILSHEAFAQPYSRSYFTLGKYGFIKFPTKDGTFSEEELEEINQILQDYENVSDGQQILANFGGHIHGFEKFGKELRFFGQFSPIDLYFDANWQYPSLSTTPVLTTEALMVGGNEKDLSNKGLIRIVKIEEKEKINFSEIEFKEPALNPYITFEFKSKIVGNFIYPCLIFVPQTFSKREIDYFLLDFGDDKTEITSPLILEGKTIHCYSPSTLPATYNVTLIAIDKETNKSEYITKKVEIREGIIPKIIKIGEDLKDKVELMSMELNERVTEFGRTMQDWVWVKMKHSPASSVGLISVHFENALEDIDLLQLKVDIDFQNKKSLLYIPQWPLEIERSKILFVPK